jgi:hypothetical protein
VSKTPSPADLLLADEVAVHKIGSRTDSAALLAWFLTNVWRIEPEDVDSIICDGTGDKGIDALVVDDDLNEITVLQSKHRPNPANTTQGDQDLKNLVGAASWFESPDTVDSLLAAKPNQELRKLVIRQEVRDKLASGDYATRLVFVTNAALDRAGSDYLEARKGAMPTLEFWGRDKLTEAAERTRRPELRTEEVTLVTASSVIDAKLTENEKLVVAMIPAKQLVLLPGIADRTLFSRNVRLFAGRTRINKELMRSVRNLDEHRLFPAFHNGLTLLTGEVTVNKGKVTLNGVGVVNGCQSLITLHENSDSVTDQLQILVKIVETGHNDAVADQITYRSNNQNAVTLRDQRSSDNVMRDLQVSVQQTFGKHFALQTRVGEQLDAENVLENSLAAQLIMATYLEEPSLAVRKVRLFDQDFRRIFNRTVTAHRLWLLYLIDGVVNDNRSNLRDDLRSSFASVRFTLVHLMCQVLRLSEAGERLLDKPERWLRDEEEKVLAALDLIASEVVESVNYHVKEKLDADDDYDPKVAFKSRAGISPLESDVVRDAKRTATRATSYLFTVTPSPAKPTKTSS